MEQWPSGQGAGLPNQRSQVQNHKVAEKLPQLSSFKDQSKEYQGFKETLWLKVSLQSDCCLQTTELYPSTRDNTDQNGDQCPILGAKFGCKAKI